MFKKAFFLVKLQARCQSFYSVSEIWQLVADKHFRFTHICQPEDKRLKTKPILAITTRILSGTYPPSPYGFHFCLLQSIQTLYHSVLTDVNGLVRWMDHRSVIGHLKVKPMLYFASARVVEASWLRSGCRVSPSSLMTRDSLWHGCLCWWTLVCDHVCRCCLQGP